MGPKIEEDKKTLEKETIKEGDKPQNGSKENVEKTYEEIYNEEQDKKFLVKMYMDTNKKLDELTSLIEKNMNGNFSTSEVKDTNQDQKQEQEKTQEQAKQTVTCEWHG